MVRSSSLDTQPAESSTPFLSGSRSITLISLRIHGCGSRDWRAHDEGTDGVDSIRGGDRGRGSIRAKVRGKDWRTNLVFPDHIAAGTDLEGRIWPHHRSQQVPRMLEQQCCVEINPVSLGHRVPTWRIIFTSFLCATISSLHHRSWT